MLYYRSERNFELLAKVADLQMEEVKEEERTRSLEEESHDIERRIDELRRKTLRATDLSMIGVCILCISLKRK